MQTTSRLEPSGNSRQSGNQLVFQVCPANGCKWKTYLNPETGAWICFKCNARGVARGYQSPMQALLQKIFPVATRTAHPEEISLPEWEPLTKMATRYLLSRGISSPAQFGIVSLVGSPRILIPYYGPYGRVIYWTTRSYMDDGKPKYMTAPGKHPLYVLPEWTTYEDEVTFVEGVFDAIAHFSATGKPTVAIGGKTLPSYLVPSVDYISCGSRTVMLDSDALAYSVRLAKLLGGKFKMLPPGHDPASYYMGGNNGND